MITPLFAFAALLPAIGKALLSIGTAVIGAFASSAATRASLGKRYNDYMNGTTGSGLTTAQIQQNAFTMQQQEAQQRFNAEQAALNRQWQERMSNTAYQRGTADMAAAGLNPAMMYGGSAASASTPSGSAASSAAPAGASPSNVQSGVLDSLLNMAFSVYRLQGLALDNEGKKIENNINQIELDNRDDALKSQIRFVQQQEKTSAAQASEALQAVETGKADEALKRAGISTEEARACLTWLEAIYQNKNNEYFDSVKEYRRLIEERSAAKSEKELEEIDAQIGYLFAQTASARAQKELFGAEYDKVVEETKRTTEETKKVAAETKTEKYNTQRTKHLAEQESWRAMYAPYGERIALNTAFAEMLAAKNGNAGNPSAVGTYMDSDKFFRKGLSHSGYGDDTKWWKSIGGY